MLIAAQLAAAADLADPAGAARARWTPVASFGDDADTITVSRVADPGTAASAEREAAARQAAGRALAGNPRLGLDPKAANLILAGRVDARALAVLAAVTASTRCRSPTCRWWPARTPTPRAG